ncbi:MAG: TetR/AcrR family transcriptional regulator [Burkholderiaceae bacterium]
MSRENSQTRENILKAAIGLLMSDQRRGVRMSDIAKAAGISRQAVYLHFATRAELLIAATHYVDQLNAMDETLRASRVAQTGVERLDAYIDAWANYVPKIYGMAKALMAMSDTDAEAAQAWGQRMQDVREGCEAAVKALHKDQMLASGYTQKQATDILWMLMSVRNWEQLTGPCQWSPSAYSKMLKRIARDVLLKST